MGKLSLLLIEAVEVIRAQLECCGDVQKITCASAHFCGRLQRHTAGLFKDRIREATELENPIPQMPLEVVQRRLGLGNCKLSSKNAQLKSIDDFEYSQGSYETLPIRIVHDAHSSNRVTI